MRKFIKVKLTYEGTHFWPEADSLPEVAFLKNEHRHLFYITLVKEVSHGDREIEIIMFKRQVERDLEVEHQGKLGRMSCEELAEKLLTQYDCESVEVLEDNENGALIYK